MADFDSQLPIRSLAADNETRLADSANAIINPAKEDGNLLSVKTAVEILDNVVNVNNEADVNLKAVAGTATETNYGTPSTGAQRVAAMLGVGSTAVSISNPVPVNIISGAGGTNVHDYDTASAVAAGATDTHSFTPVANFILHEIYFAASGQMKVEIQWGVTGAETTKTVQFTSKGDLNGVFRLTDGQLIQTTDTIKIIRTNTEPGQAQDLYSSIHGIAA